MASTEELLLVKLTGNFEFTVAAKVKLPPAWKVLFPGFVKTILWSPLTTWTVRVTGGAAFHEESPDWRAVILTVPVPMGRS